MRTVERAIRSELTIEEARNLATIAALEPLWNRHDVAGILAHYDDAIRWEDVARGEVMEGKAAVAATLEELFSAIPDLTLRITARIPRGELVAEEYTLAGTHRGGSLFGVPATGRPVSIRVMSMLRLRDARMVEDHFHYDVSSLLHQLGLFPPLSVARTRPGRLAMHALVAARFPGRALVRLRCRRAGR